MILNSNMELAASLLHKAWIGYVQVVNQAQEQVIRFSSRDNLKQYELQSYDRPQVEV
jgi:hypothetical protein